MNISRAVPPFVCLSALTFLASSFTALAAPPVLRWNGSSGAAWDATSANWLDTGDNAVAWQPGATAQFDGGGGLVNVAADMLVSNMTFSTGGYTLLGAGRLTVEGALSAATATTNSVATRLRTANGLAKTGSGTLALARCAGALSVQQGALLASGSLFLDADLSVASGASLVTLGDPDTASNLLLNSGFEDPVLANGAWAYRDIPSWTRAGQASFVGMKNTAAAGEWALLGASPEGVQMAIVQGGGALSQTVTVPSAGLYAIAFSYQMRNQSPAKTNQVYVLLSGVPLAAFVNNTAPTTTSRFSSGALWLNAGTHTLTVAGEADHGWADCTTLLDAVCLAPPSASQPCRALGGDSTLALVTGASAVLAHSGTATATLVTLDGTAAPGGAAYDASHASGLFSGPGTLAAQPPENVFAQSASGNWSASGTWLGGAAPAAGGGGSLLLRLTADSANDLAGGFAARRVQLLGAGATLSGNTLALAGPLTQPADGAWTLSAPVAAGTAFTADNAGSLTLSQPLGLATNGLFVKRGAGRLNLSAFTNGFNTAYLYGGTVALGALPATPASWDLFSSDGTPVTLTFTAPGTVARRLNLYGSGLPGLAVAAGGTVTLSDWTVAFGNNAAFDVASGDTLSLRQLLRSRLDNNMASAPSLLKTGPGTLEIRSGGADTDKNRAYPGTTTLRNGTLRLLEDDWGTLSGWTNPFNGRTYTATGGSLGYNLLTNAVVVGDAGTAASDSLAIIASGNGRYIGHNLEIFNRGSTVTLGMTAGTAKFGGTITLHRDIALSGPADGVLVLDTVVAAPDFAGTGAPALSGLAGLVVEGSLPAAAALVLNGRALSFGTLTVKAQSLNALVLGSAGTPGALAVDFGAGANDTVTVTTPNGLVLSNTVVTLTCAGSGLPFSEPGTYTLFNYAGTLGGDVALLSVGNPQAGASYAFSNDTANSRVVLTIGNTSGGASVTWKRADSGNWSLGSNWDTGSAPSAANVTPLFGLAINTPATVTLDTAYTVGGLTFNNPSFGYTLSGGSLTLDAGGATPLVSVATGTHTLNTTLNGANGLAVTAASGATLALGGSAAVNTGLSLSQGTVELQGAAAVNGATALGASTLLRAVGSATAVGSLSGPSSATVALSGTTPKLTVNQAADATFAGTLTGTAPAVLAKAGSGTLTVNAALQPFSGQAKVEAGTLALRSVTLPALTDIGAAGTLAVAAPVTNGLTGYFYDVTPNTNAYWTLAAMESRFASLTPAYAALSGASSNIFDFGVGTPYAISGPYTSSGSRSTNFEVAWRGLITVPTNGTYTFGAYGDDGYLLAIGGQQILARNFWNASWAEGTVTLEAGQHDIVLGYFQLTGGGGIRLQVRQPNQTSAIPLPNTWLKPYTQTGPLAGSGALSLASADSALRTRNAAGVQTFGGSLSGAASAFFAKHGSGVQSLSGGAANTFAGGADIQEGMLTLDADERLSDSAPLTIRSGATLALAGAETVGSLSGAGTLAIGGNVYVVPFTDDADCGISTAKTYTHLLDFPANGNPATVNGVLFTAADMSGSAGGYAWSTVNPPTGTWNSAPNDATRTGVDRLLWDFIYGSMDFTITLSNLTPGKSYETRLYFRNFASNTRFVTFTCTVGAREVGSLYYNPDSGAAGARSWVGCRYTADAAGTVAIRVLSHVTNDKCHLYGLSNEEFTGATEPVLTVAPAAGTTRRFTGAVSGLGTLVKQGAGTQRFSGALTLASPLDVQAGTAALDAGAALPAGATVASGATLKAPLGSVTLGALTGKGALNLTGAADYSTVTNGPRFVAITGDADCGISADKVYTHLMDFGGSTAIATVNGVTFNKERLVTGPASGYSWINAPATSAHAGGNTGNIGVPSSQGVYNLINDFCYAGPYGPTVFYLTGLTTGRWYEVRFYHRKWEATKARNTTMTFDPDGAGPISDSISFNPDSPAGSYNDNYLAYRYLAVTNRLAVTITCPNTDKYHIYGLSNEEVPASLAGVTTLDISSDTVFDGALTGRGALNKTGAGAFAVTGASTATGPVTVGAGAFGPAEGGTATLGNVSVAAGATLFGHGLVGGSASLASGAFIHGGTPEAPGALQVGGALSLAAGSQTLFRFTTLAADTITVAGTLTIPSAGVVTASALEEGAKPPAKTALYTSSTPINGPADLTGWSVEGVENCLLSYSADKTIIYLRSPRGTAILIR